MMKIELLDYILDFDDNFWVVNEINEDKGPLGYLVYKRVKDQNARFNNYTGCYYTKLFPKSLVEIPRSFKKIFKPRRCLKDNKTKLPQLWLQFVEALNEVGVKDDYIGIFGSYLIGFDIIKDVDFVVYGFQNLMKVYNNLNYIRERVNATPITVEHIEYQYNKHKDLYNPKCDLKALISSNIFGMQLEKGLLSTLRFINKNRCVVPSIKNSKKEIIIGKVTDGLTSAFLPRYAKILVDEKIYTVYTSKWKFQSFATRNKILEIYGYVNHDFKTIVLNEESYIKYKD